MDRYDYIVLDSVSLDKLEDVLNRVGRDGFRLAEFHIQRGPETAFCVLERALDPQQFFELEANRKRGNCQTD